MRKNYTLQERERMIILQFAIAIQNDQKRWRTQAEIAKAIGMSRCPSLAKILLHMVQQGDLVMRQIERKGRWPGYEYMLPAGSFQEPYKVRSIPIRANGKQRGQLELFG